MESVEIERAVGPFTTRNVHEWSSLDQLGGLIEHARVHTDHWTASTSNSSHHFGKVVDSRSRELANGGKEQQQQTKQLEMFQAQIPGGSVQVIRSSTSSSWQTHHKLTLNPLDISLQKTKAWIGRSGSIGGRRPPSRTRSIVGSKAEERFDQLETNTVPTEIKTTSIGETVEKGKENDDIIIEKTSQESVHSNQNSHKQSDELNLITNDYKHNSTVCELISGSTAPRNHFSITRQKSCSSENLNYLDEDEKTNSNHIIWNRSSSVRRSLQFPSKSSTSTKDNIICPQRKSVSEIRKEIEERKQLISYALSEKGLGPGDEHIDTHFKDRSRLLDVSSLKTRQTVVTAESLKDVRGRLRKLSSNESNIFKDDNDDCTDNKIDSSQEQLSESPKKLYLFGMEVKLRPLQENATMENNKSITNGVSHKWHNERKPYAFEEEANRNTNITSLENQKIEPSTADSGIFISSATFPSAPNMHIVKPPKAESSIHTTHNITIKPYKDPKSNSIARDAVVQTGRKTIVNVTRNGDDSNCGNRFKNGGRSMQQEKRPEDPDTWKIADSGTCLQEKSQSQQFSKPITISIPVQKNSEFDLTDPKKLLLKQTDSLRGSDNNEGSNTINENGITSYSQLIFGRDIGQKNSLNNNGIISENIPWRTGRTKTLSNFFDSEFKRHSIAVDKAKYLKPTRSFRSNYGLDNEDFGTNHNLYDSNEKLINSTSESDHEINPNDKRHKKVEFSKTEVHFAAEPGRFNIVETDGKPPPSTNYGRRRKTKTEVSKLTGQPVIRFGDIPDEHLLFKRNETMLFNETLSPPSQLASQKNLALHNSDKDSNVPANSETTFQTKLFNIRPTYKIDVREPTFELKGSNENSSLKSRSIIHFKSENSYLVGETPDHSNQDETWRVKVQLNSENGTSQCQPEEPKGISQHSKEPPTLSKETEFQKMLRSLRMTEKKPADIFCERTQLQPCSSAAENGLEVRIASSSVTPDNRRASWSFFERVRHFDNAKGFSTKVNFGPQQSTLIDSPTLSYRSSDMQIKSKPIQEHKHSSDSTQSSSEHEPTSTSKQIKRQTEDFTMTTQRLPFSPYDKGLETHLAQPMQSYKLTDSSHRTPAVKLNSVKSNSDEFKVLYRTERSCDTDGVMKLSSLLREECAQQERFAKKANKDAITISDAQSTLRDLNLNSHHHSRDISVLGRSTKNTLCNRNNRDQTRSPTNQTSRKGSSKTVTSLAKTPTDLVHNSLNKNNLSISASKPCSIQVHNKLNTDNSTNPTTAKLEEKTNLSGKKSDRYKTEDRLKRRNKKPITVESGRDGWLNVSKDIQPRNKSEPSVKKAIVKKEITTKTSNNSGARTSKERKGSMTEKNQEMYEDLSDARERESNISDELMKAADQILLAVNGYTDDDSIITSSSNEGHSRKEHRSLGTLRTIYEPPIKQSNTNKNKTKQHIRSTRSTDLRMESISKKKEGRMVSSLSSRESGAESHSSSKDRRMHRATRLMQRASSRENMFQGTASSSEDLGSGSDTGALRNKRVYRKPRLKHRCSRQEKSTDTNSRD